MAQNGSQHAQRAVVWALGSMQDKGQEDRQQVDQVLSELVTSASSRVAAAALDQVARRQGKTALPLLIRSFREGSVDLQATALRALATIDDPASKKLIMEAVSSGIPNLTHQGVQALVTMEGPGATDTLIGLLQQGDPRSQASAAHALAQVGGPRAREALLEAFKDDKVPGGITYALGQMADAQTTEQLTQLINDNSVSTHIKEQAIQALSYGSSPDALLKVAAHSDGEIAAKAMLRLGSMGGPEAEALLLDALSSARGPKQQAALTSLASMGTPKAVEAISQTLHDKELKDGAFGALASIGTQKAMDTLTDYYRSADSTDRAKIVRQLAYNQSSRARHLLEQAIDDSSETVAAHAAGALARMGGKQISGRLVALLQSGPSKAVRYAIASALRWSTSALYRQHKELIMRVYSEGT
jgi:HEAT repeat protein